MKQLLTCIALLSVCSLACCLGPFGIEGEMGEAGGGNNSKTKQPLIRTILPNIGDVNGGTKITIDGLYFEPESRVYIGDKECLNAVVNSSTSISCLSPAGSIGIVDVVIEYDSKDVAIMTGAYQYIRTSLYITGPNGGVNFTTSEKSQILYGTCSKNISTVSIAARKASNFSDSYCIDGTWMLSDYTLDTGMNHFTITGRTADGEASAEAAIDIQYSTDTTSSILITAPNNGEVFTTSDQIQILSGTCSTDITNLTTNLGNSVLLDGDCSDGTWSMYGYALHSGVNSFIISGLGIAKDIVLASILITYNPE